MLTILHHHLAYIISSPNPFLFRKLEHHFQRPLVDTFTTIDVHPDARPGHQNLLSYGLPNMLIVGNEAYRYFIRMMPPHFHVKHLRYSAVSEKENPKILIVHDNDHKLRFFTALLYAMPVKGQELFNGCVFLLEDQWSLRERLYVHLARNHFAGCESSIFHLADRGGFFTEPDCGRL